METDVCGYKQSMDLKKFKLLFSVFSIVNKKLIYYDYYLYLLINV